MSQKIDKIIIYWARRDFRLEDNPALFECVSICKKSENTCFLPLFILEDYMLEARTDFQFGLPSRYFLSRAIPKFGSNFQEFLLFKGKGARSIIDLVGLIQNIKNSDGKLEAEIEIEIHINEDVYADFYKQIEKLETNSANYNLIVKVHTDQLTISKDTVSGTGNRYSVFTPFKKAVWKEFVSAKVLPKVTKSDLEKIKYLPENILKHISNSNLQIVEASQEKIWQELSKSRKFEVIDYETSKKHVFDIDKILESKNNLPENAYAEWYFDEDSAKMKMKSFVKNLLSGYKENRDSLEKDVQENDSREDLLTGKTSKLSLALVWGLVSARQLRCEIQHHFDEDFLNVDWYDKEISDARSGILTYLSELIWREFYKYLLYHNPKLMNEEFQDKFKFKVNWVEEGVAVERFTAWMRGETGYKVVDAAMIQLAQTGWMHNRARMIVASVLTKNLGVDWRWGQEYFRAMLIDLDEASNNGGWQWGASVGADPKPIRIFNPYLQAENYDKSNAYQKKWLGEEKFFFGGEPMVPHVIARGEAMKRYGLDKNKDL